MYFRFDCHDYIIAYFKSAAGKWIWTRYLFLVTAVPHCKHVHVKILTYVPDLLYIFFLHFVWHEKKMLRTWICSLPFFPHFVRSISTNRPNDSRPPSSWVGIDYTTLATKPSLLGVTNVRFYSGLLSLTYISEEKNIFKKEDSVFAFN